MRPLKSNLCALLAGSLLAVAPAFADNHEAETAISAGNDVLAILLDITEQERSTPLDLADPLLEQLITIVGGETYHKVQLYFATNRALSNRVDPDRPTVQFTAESGPLRYGFATVNIPPNHQVGHLELPNALDAFFGEVDPFRHVLLDRMDVLSEEVVLASLRAQLEGDAKRTLLYIHGFNVGVETVALRAGQITYDLDWRGPSFFFSWPSKDSGWAYNADKESARGSRRDLMQVLERIAQTETEQIVVIAHSMGTDLLAQTLELMEVGNSPALAKISTVVLAAPDINEDIFREDIVPAISAIRAEHPDFAVTVYASASDTALSWSNFLHSEPRIGEMSALTIEQLDAYRPVQMVDASKAETNFLGHTYINDNPSVIRDVYCMLQMGPAPTDRPVTLEGVPNPDGPQFRIRGRDDSLDNTSADAQFECG